MKWAEQPDKHSLERDISGVADTGTRGVIEQYTIEPIPLNERKGRGSDLFTIWFAIQVGPVVLITGALGPLLFEQSFLWTLVAVLVGNVVGGILVTALAVLVTAGAAVYGAATIIFGAFRLADLRGLVRRRPAAQG